MWNNFLIYCKNNSTLYGSVYLYSILIFYRLHVCNFIPTENWIPQCYNFCCVILCLTFLNCWKTPRCHLRSKEKTQKTKACIQKISKDTSGVHNSTYRCGHFLSQLLTDHYEQSRKYYCLNDGLGGFGSASEEELRLTRRLFWGIFSALAKKVRKGSFIRLKYAIRHVTIKLIASKKCFLDGMSVLISSSSNFIWFVLLKCVFFNLVHSLMMQSYSNWPLVVSVQLLARFLLTTLIRAAPADERNTQRWIQRDSFVFDPWTPQSKTSIKGPRHMPNQGKQTLLSWI